jgi:hypothetical protein
MMFIEHKYIWSQDIFVAMENQKAREVAVFLAIVAMTHMFTCGNSCEIRVNIKIIYNCDSYLNLQTGTT